MTSGLGSLPIELYTNTILPSLGLDAKTLCAFSRTSKSALSIIYKVALSYNSNLNPIETQNYTNICNRPTLVKSCIYEILKARIEERFPQNHSQLVTDALRFNPSPMAVTTLQPFDKALIAAISNHKDPALAELFLVQRESDKIPGDSVLPNNLGHVLTIAIYHLKNPKLVRTILSLPNAKHIVGHKIGFDCLGGALIEAVRINSLKITKLVLSHKNAANIPGVSSCGETSYSKISTLGSKGSTLYGALNEAVKVKNPKLVYKIVSHPNAKDIPFFGECFLTNAIESQDPLVIAAVLHHPKASNLRLEDLVEAGKVMLSEEDKATILQLRQMLENKESFKLKEFGETFVTLTTGIQYLFYLLLCKTHGRLNNTIDKDGMVHFIKKPLSLLPIIEQLVNRLEVVGDAVPYIDDDSDDYQNLDSNADLYN